MLDRKIEVLTADHLNKADYAASKARESIDQRDVRMIIGGANSAAALAVNKVISDKKRVFFSVAAGSARLTNEECTPYTVHYEYDTVALARVAGSAVVDQGGKDWFMLVSDYSFGHSLFSEASAVIKAKGGSVLGSAKHPPLSNDRNFVLHFAGADVRPRSWAWLTPVRIRSIRSRPPTTSA